MTILVNPATETVVARLLRRFADAVDGPDALDAFTDVKNVFIATEE
jgi:hypothetical protein